MFRNVRTEFARDAVFGFALTVLITASQPYELEMLACLEARVAFACAFALHLLIIYTVTRLALYVNYKAQVQLLQPSGAGFCENLARRMRSTRYELMEHA